jgi:hypothetical protein
MRIFVCTILLGLLAPPPGSATVPEEKLRDRLFVCSQLVIDDPGPAVVRELADGCCRPGNPIRDCHVYDQDG